MVSTCLKSQLVYDPWWLPAVLRPLGRASVHSTENVMNFDFCLFGFFIAEFFNVIFHMYFKYKPIKCLNHVNSHVPITFNRMANNICDKKREKKNCHQVFYALKLLCTKSVRHCCSIFLLNRGKSFTIIRDYGVC